MIPKLHVYYKLKFSAAIFILNDQVFFFFISVENPNSTFVSWHLHCINAQHMEHQLTYKFYRICVLACVLFILADCGLSRVQLLR